MTHDELCDIVYECVRLYPTRPTRCQVIDQLIGPHCLSRNDVNVVIGELIDANVFALDHGLLVPVGKFFYKRLMRESTEVKQPKSVPAEGVTVSALSTHYTYSLEAIQNLIARDLDVSPDCVKVRYKIKMKSRSAPDIRDPSTPTAEVTGVKVTVKVKNNE